MFNSSLSVALLNSLPIAFDFLVMKRRWKSLFHWSLVALILFLVSFLFLLFCSEVLMKNFDVGKRTLRPNSGFHSEVYIVSIGRMFFQSETQLRCIFCSVLGASGGH